MIKIRCVIEGITYQNQGNGYSVLRVKVKEYNDLVTIVGTLLDVPVGAVLMCEGDWKVDKRFGRQFVVQTYEEVMPATVYGIEKYLGSGLVKGIGQTKALSYAIRNLTVSKRNTLLKERLKGKAGKVEQPLSTVPPKPYEYMKSESYSMAADPGSEYGKKQK